MLNDEEEIFDQAYAYATSSVVDLLETIIQNFKRYQLTGEELVAIAKLYQLTTASSDESYDDMLSFGIKTQLGGGSFKVQEIKFDNGGLQLGYEGWEQNEFGGDGFLEVVLPFEDADEAVDSMSVIDTFLEEFEQGLSNTENERVIEHID